MSARYEFYGPTGHVRNLPSPPLPPRRPPEGAIGDAVLRWGRPSNFQIGSTSRNTIFITQPSYDDLGPADDENLGLIFTETERTTTTVRVSNPEDAEDFVDVERIDQITFLGPDGVLRTFVLNN